MYSTRFVIGLLLLFISSTAFRYGHAKEPAVFRYAYENVLGTSFDLKVWSTSENLADAAEGIALEETDRLNAILSTYDTNSEFSRWQQTLHQPVKVSPELFEILQEFTYWQQQTRGALNPAIGQLVTQWKKAEQEQQLPDPAVLQSLSREISMAHWALDPVKQEATHLDNIPLVFNSFVKSYIIRKVVDKLMQQEGITGVIVNIGGDMLAAGSARESVQIADPLHPEENASGISMLNLSGKALATSGNYKRGYRIKGQWYSHIFDPSTGAPVEEVISATVLSPDAVVAGALATAFNILHPDAAAQLAANYPGTEYLIITKNGTRFTSNHWPATVTSPVKPVSETGSVLQKSWNTDYEVAISLELMRFEGRSRRPFVAVWVENSDKQVVRTVALWFNKPRWLPDLREWFRKNKDTYQNGPKDVYSISSATRAAGSYTLKWDGKDDSGQYVKPGTYTIYIEAAREHGGYELLHQEVDCRKKEKEFSLKGSIELAGASVSYKKTSAQNP